MNLKKRGNKWTARVNIQNNGERSQKRLTQEIGESYEDFVTRAKDLEVKARKGEYFEASKSNVEKFLYKWLKIHTADKSPKTYSNYKMIFDKHVIPEIGKVPLGKLKPIHIKEMYTKMKDRPQLVIYIHRVLHAAFRTAYLEWQVISSNPVDHVKPPAAPHKKETRTWRKNTIQDFTIKKQDHILYLPVVLAAATGMRRAEICGLTWDCIDMDNCLIYVRHQLQRVKLKKEEVGKLELRPTKSYRSDRPIKVSQEIIDILKEHRKDQMQKRDFFEGEYNDSIPNLVVRWQDGRPILPDYISEYFPRISEQLGLPRIKFHALRHSHATELIRSGIDLLIVSRRLGHSKLNITADIYSHVDPDMQEPAANVIKFGNREEKIDDEIKELELKIEKLKEKKSKSDCG